MAKVMMLGAGECQINLINKLIDRKHEVIVCDYYENSPGKKINEKNYLVSTFDLEKNLDIAINEAVDCLITAGTDQPVKTVSYISEKMGIRSFLSYDQSLDLTNKKRMKRIFMENKIAYVDYQLIERDIEEKDIFIQYPAVLKPVDSQGQRGIYKVKDFKELKKYILSAFQFTNEKEILLESYYPNDEITVSGWVENGKIYVLSISDRETFPDDINIGICKGHRYPSIHCAQYQKEIVALTNKIVKSFKIEEGPIYFQMLIGDEGIKVNEIAARLGGAYEDEYIPIATGVSLLDLLIDRSLNDYTVNYLKNENYLEINQYIYVFLLFLKKGIIKSMTPLADISVIHSGKLFVKVDDVIGDRINATQRIGYAIVVAGSEEELEMKIKIFWEEFKVEMETK
ncbi:MAG: ATP-grasp domain-containing protein [Clostridiales bacterium]|nr:ATP-grasp domain-containing protein [Clostridiales bacterium]